MDTFILLTKIFGISFTSGINLYATVALVGLAVRFNLISNLPHQLDVLAHDYVIATALVLYTCEFVADKIPAFDTIWDTFHTFIRPFAAAMLALMAAGDTPMIVKVIAVLLAGSVALTSHTAKAGIRLVANTSPEPVSNSFLSIAEDLGVIFLVTLTLTHPIIAAVIVLMLLLLILWQGPKFIGLIFFIFKAVSLKICSYFKADKFVNAEILPEKMDNYLSVILNQGEKVYLVLDATFKGLPATSGYFVVTDSRFIMLYKKWFKSSYCEVLNQEISRLNIKRGFLCDKIAFSRDNKQVLIVLFKSNSRTIDDIKNIFESLNLDIINKELQVNLPEAEIV